MIAVPAFVVGVAVERPPTHESVSWNVGWDLCAGEGAKAQKKGEGEEVFHCKLLFLQM
jgi:hypothetical protein